MVPYQLSAARPFHPISWTRASVSPARPVMLVLLKTTTPTSLRSTGGLVVFGSSGVRGLGGVGPVSVESSSDGVCASVVSSLLDDAA